MTLEPPRLRDDCFAMPRGVDWVPVDVALGRLRAALLPLGGSEQVPVGDAAGRVLAEPVVARRANPPGANAAVDGYGFSHAATAPGRCDLPLVKGRAAAGVPYEGTVPEGRAIRILTGALLPEGVDTVVLEEDCATDGARVVFDGPLRKGANTRRAGEDFDAGAVVVEAGRRLTPADLALVAAAGRGTVVVRPRLRVGVLSTGDELADAEAADAPGRTVDANRPMLLALLAGWGMEAVDLGRVGDDGAALRAVLDRAAGRCDTVVTTGGASAGDEDHVSRLLRTEGRLTSWRIAMKPGRPLVLAEWGGMPVFGLPGNPVAALVTALVFVRPAVLALAGAGWREAEGFPVPAGFVKSKKAGRREYLRARIRGGRAEVFRSEGSGRISGLGWAEGLVELPDEAMEVAEGDLVQFIPFEGVVG